MSSVHAQTISSNLQVGEIVCPDSEVIFTCETRNSAAIAWRGDFYVGVQLGFSAELSNVQERLTTPFNEHTVAILTKNDIESGERVLESTLRIVASASSPNASVTCVHTDSGNMNSSKFQVLGESSNGTIFSVRIWPMFVFTAGV